MALFLRLEELVRQKTGDLKRGLFKEIAAAIDMSERKVSLYFRNKVPHIDMKELTNICAYLVEMEYVDASAIPRELFGERPAEFWNLIARAERIEFVMGARSNPRWKDDYVMAADAELMARLLHGVSIPMPREEALAAEKENGKAKKKQKKKKKKNAQPGRIIDVICAPAPPREPDLIEGARATALGQYQAFDKHTDARALILIGSIKSNLLIEYTVADTLRGAHVFESQDDVDRASDRTSPFVLIYREDDRRVPSICAGDRLSKSGPDVAPGIYYETADGTWAGIAETAECAAAYVFYRYRKTINRLDMVLGGFSAVGTRRLAAYLAHNAEVPFWPPSYIGDQVEIGIFVLGLHGEGESGEAGSPGHVVAKQCVPLDESVIARRVDH